MKVASFQSRSLGSAAPVAKRVFAQDIPNLTTSAVDTLVKSFEQHPNITGISPQHAALLADRLPIDLDVRLTVPNISNEAYYRRVLEAYGNSWGGAVDIAQHGNSYKQAFCELYVASLLEKFGEYDHSSLYEAEFMRPAIDSAHIRWGDVYPKAPPQRVDGLRARERNCAGAIQGDDLDRRILSGADSGWPYFEQLKAGVKASMPAYEASFAWASVDRSARLQAAQTLLAARSASSAVAAQGLPTGEKKGADKGAPADAAASGLPEVPEVLTIPYTEIAEKAKKDAELVSLAADDVCDCAVEGPGSYLREWVEPAMLADWRSTGLWPAVRNESILSTRAKELVTLLERIAVCEDFVFRLRLHRLPSHLDLELVTSRLPNLSSLSVTYGAGEAGVRFDRSSFGIQQRDVDCIVRVLRASDSLTTLSLPSVGLDDVFLAPLVAGLLDNASVTHLDLSSNSITDAGTELLAKLLRGGSHGCVLVSLNLSDNLIGVGGGRWLGRALRHNDTLMHLDLRLNAVGDAGGTALIQGLVYNSTLQRLHLGSSRVSSQTVASLSAAISAPACALEVVDLSMNGLQVIDLELLAQTICGHNDGSGAASVAHNTRLVSLDLRGSPGLDQAVGTEANQRLQAVLRANESRKRGGLGTIVPAFTAAVSS